MRAKDLSITKKVIHNGQPARFVTKYSIDQKQGYVIRTAQGLKFYPKIGKQQKKIKGKNKRDFILLYRFGQKEIKE